MNSKNCSGATFLRSFALLLLLSAGFIPPAYAKHQFLSWSPFPQQSQFTQQFRGAGEPIVIAWGSIEYLSNDLTPGVCPDGISNSLNAVADVYVVKSGTVYRYSPFRLNLRDLDVSGAVNTIIQDNGG